MAKWTNEDAYDSYIVPVSAKYRIAVPLIKAIIGAESGFVPSAYRAEPQIGDASRGLMQILYGTAKAVGYTGAADGLFDPATNLEYAVKFFADLANNAVANGWTVDSAISAYNAGGSGDRAGDGKRSTSRKDGKTADGSALAPFVNQPYVDRVRSYWEYFKSKGSTGNPQQLAPVVVTPEPVQSADVWPWVIAGVVLVIAVATLTRD